MLERQASSAGKIHLRMANQSVGFVYAQQSHIRYQTDGSTMIGVGPDSFCYSLIDAY